MFRDTLTLQVHQNIILIISQKRADNVKAYLISQGVSPDRVIIEYYGATHPIASNKSAEGRRKNRRVELEMVKN